MCIYFPTGLLVGGNDIANGTPNTVALNNYLQLLKYIRDINQSARIVVFALPPRNFDVPKVDIMTFNNLLQSLPNHMAGTVTVMQTFDTFVKKNEVTLSDFDPSGKYPLLHLTKSAKVRLSHIIERALTKELRLQGLIPPKVVTDTNILSPNFPISPEIHGLPTSQHAFQLCKAKHFRDWEAACNIASSGCPQVAEMWGGLIIRSPTLDKLWSEKVNAVIEMLIIKRARKDVKFRRYLKETRTRDIIVMVKGDLGVTSDFIRNDYGQLLMKVRHQVKR